MNPAKKDPKVSCPIVCDEYMRATSFFFTADNQTYLITARHNFLPVNATELDSGDLPLNYCTRNRFTTIDVYLRNNSTFTVKRVHPFEKQGILFDGKIDLIGVPVNFDPEKYGYILWTLDDITTPDASSTTVDVIGYPSRSFPDNVGNDTDRYKEEITSPYVLSLLNDFQTNQQIPTDTGCLSIGIDTGSKKSIAAYNGYSGSPVLGNGLVGIHCLNFPATADNIETDTMGICYWRAGVLNKFFQSQ